MRIEMRLDASMAVRFGNRYVTVTACEPRPKVPPPKIARAHKPAAPRAKSRWMENFRLTRPEKTVLTVIAAQSKVRSLKPIR